MGLLSRNRGRVLVEILVAIVVGLIQMTFAGAVFVSMVLPERAPQVLKGVPLGWRLLTLLCVSILCGIIIQLAGVSYRFH